MRLFVEKVPSGGELTGRLVVTGAGDHRDARLSLQVSGKILGQLKQLDTDPDMLTVVSWPGGAPVYLVGLSSEYPWTRQYVGTTPIQFRLPAGRYQVVLVQPVPGRGSWAGPTGQAGSVGSGSKTAATLSVDCTKEKGVPAVVRALWLTREGPMVERVIQATKGSEDLFSLPPLEKFRDQCFQTFGRARVELTEADVEKMYGVVRKTGYLRYEVNEQEAIDLEFRPGVREPFRFTAVKLTK